MVKLQRTTSDNEDFRSLIKELDKDLLGRYKDQQAVYDQHNIIESNRNVIVAYKDGEVVGCGCFKKFSEGTVEIKRMYVKPQHRGQKIAASILQELEKWASELNNTTAVLETGIRQEEAIHLYRKSGYLVIENYGPYKNMPESVCMQKEIIN
jgi:GNAT superfamily N-acetyltransferase